MSMSFMTSPEQQLTEAICEFEIAEQNYKNAAMAIEYSRAALVHNTRDLFPSDKKRGRFIAGEMGKRFCMLDIAKYKLETKARWLKMCKRV